MHVSPFVHGLVALALVVPVGAGGAVDVQPAIMGDFYASMERFELVR